MGAQVPVVWGYCVFSRRNIMSRSKQQEVRLFYDKAFGWSAECLTSIKSKLNLDDVVQAAKSRTIDDILFIRTLQY